MNILRRSGVPLGHIGLGDAYEEAFRRLESADELLAAIAPDKWVQISGSPTVHAELPAPEAAEPLALKAYDDARDRVADMVGQAIVNSELDVYYTDPETGSTMLCVDRGMFARHASLVPGLGLTNFVDSLGDRKRIQLASSPSLEVLGGPCACPGAPHPTDDHPEHAGARAT